MTFDSDAPGFRGGASSVEEVYRAAIGGIAVEALTGLDAAFLALETPSAHLHATGVLVFDPATMPGGYSFEKVRRFVAGRLHFVPPFRRRLIRVGLGPPAWIEDPDFDLGNHIHRSVLAAPGDSERLAAFVADVASRPLDRSRPLWDMCFVEGLEGGHVALVARMHHATIDGVSGANLMAHLLDLEPTPADETPAPDDWRPETVPSQPGLVARALVRETAQPVRLARTAAASARGIATVAGRRLVRHLSGMAAPFSAPSTLFNASITPRRQVAFITVPLATVKAVKDACGVTVNDVVLALCGGALRRYLDARGKLPDRPLVAAVPISVRSTDVQGRGANQVSAMLVSLATDVADPLERLRSVSVSARNAKEEHEAIGRGLVADLGEFASLQLFGLGAHLYSHFRLADHHRPAANLIVSNVPGPDFPLYFAGAKLLALYPLGPIYDGMGLNITVLSYLDVIGFGFVSCADLAPDLGDLASGVTESLRELEKAAAPTS